MPEDVKISFQRRILDIPIGSVLPLKAVNDEIKQGFKYKRIARSIEEVGIIEPLVVARSKDHKNQFLLLDGHIRLGILRERGESEVRCLVADDDEAFTYNKRINRLSTVQEHYMVANALERGVSEEKLARALNVNTDAIKRRKSLLDDICPEVIELLDEKTVNAGTFRALRQMKPLRQMEVVELMVGTGNFSAGYARALLAATRQENLVRPDRPKKVGTITPEQMARMEKEMEGLQREFKAVEASYGDDVLQLVIATGYVAKLIANREIEKYLIKNHAELLAEFRSIVSVTSPERVIARDDT